MKLHKIISATLVAAAISVVAATSASAQNTTYTAGDLILGFQTTGAGSSNTVLFNLGSFQLYRDAVANVPFNVGLIGVDATLDATFGSDWNTRGDVYWGVAGAKSQTAPAPGFGTETAVNGDPSRTFYSSGNAPTPGTATPYTVGNATDNAGIVGDILATSNDFNGRVAALGTGGRGAVISTSTTVGWEDYNTLSVPIGSFGVLPSIQGNFANGTAGTTLDLFRTLSSATGANPGGPVRMGSLEGNFTINDAGLVSFTAAIPEPSTYVLLGLGVLGLAASTLRRNKIAKA